MTEGRPYISAATAVAINQARRNIHATRLVLQEPPVTIVVFRDDGSGEFLPLGQHHVDLKIADAQANQLATDTAQASKARGEVSKEAPFEINVNDEFDMPNGWRCVVTDVLPERAGIITALFEADTGYHP